MIDRRRALALAAGSAWLASGSVAARAETTLEVLPTASAGVTSNAQVTTAGSRDEFSTLSTLGRVQHAGPRANYTAGYRLAFTHYFQGRGTDTVSNEVLALSSWTLSPALELRLSASGVISRTSAIGTLALVVPQSSAQGATTYLATTAAQDLAFQPTANWRYSEGFTFARLDYLDGDPALHRPTTTLTGTARVDYLRALDGYSLDVRVTDFITDQMPGMGGLPGLPGGHNVLAQALLGWRRELALAWTAEVQAGAAYLSNGPGADVYTWAGIGTLGYRQRVWFATLQASQLPVANMFAAVATTNDQVQLRLTLPLTPDERLVVSGTAGLIYARVIDAQGGSTRAYDQQTVGADLGWHMSTLPLGASVDYLFMHQNAGPGIGAPVPDLDRHVLMFNLTAVLAFGPGTPPLLEAGRLNLPQQ